MPDRHAVDHYQDREFDALLDQALASYVDAEPDPTLRVRIITLTAEAPARRTWRIGWVAATACAAALLLAFLLYPAHRTVQDQAAQDRTLADRTLADRAVQTPATRIAPAQPPAASAKLDPTLTGSAHPHIVAATRHRYRREPAATRRGTSLSPAPLTQEETMLLRFAQQHPEQARQVLSPPPSGPLHTDPLVIAPIQIADLSGSRPDAH